MEQESTQLALAPETSGGGNLATLSVVSWARV